MNRDEHLAGVLCHCDQAEDGHPLGTPGCASEIKAGRYSQDWCQRDHYGIANCPTCHGPARGTCPECGKASRVVRVTVGLGDLVWRSLGMAPHRVGGQECPGTGAVPTETTHTPGRAEDVAA